MIGWFRRRYERLKDERDAYNRGYALAFDEVTGWLKDPEIKFVEMQRLFELSEQQAIWSARHSKFYRGKLDAMQKIKKIMEFILES